MHVQLRITIALAALALAACGPALSTYSADPAGVLRELRRNVAVSGTLSEESATSLRMAGLDVKKVLQEGETFTDSPAYQKITPEIDRLYVRSEVAIARARRLEQVDRSAAMAYYLRGAEGALNGLALDECRGAVDSRCDTFKLFYVRAILPIVKFMRVRDYRAASLALSSSQPAAYRLGVAYDTARADPSRYDFLEPSGMIGLAGLANRHRRWGLGAGMTGCRPRDPASAEDRFVPKKGTCMPLNALLRFAPGEGGVREATLEFHDALKTESVEIAGRTYPLQADFSAPIAKLVERSGISNWIGFLKALSGDPLLVKQTGFYSALPYDPQRIPVITVHGLFSSPTTWLGMQNDLGGDATIRKNYQVWHYLYPTNLPILENAATFRDRLDELYRYMQERSPGGRVPPMVVIAHSMGGLLTKTATVKSSLPLEEFLFGTPDKLRTLDAETQAELQRLLDFQSKPYIARVIFLAVPFRGSVISENWIGLLGRRMMTLPLDVVSRTVSVLAKTKAIVRPSLLRALSDEDINSIRALSPQNPVLQGLSEAAIASDIPFHLIIGDRGLGGGENSSDGVVPYTSSHMPGAESELIVPASHNVQTDPRTIEEIKRILRLDLAARGRT